jgi:glutamate-1-semialdehyde 2,1-aminomutase
VSTQTVIEKWMRRAFEKYRDRHPISAGLYNNAQKYLPGGDTRTVTFFKPYPFYIDRGEGFKLFDVDGNVYIDFLNNYTSLIHGHAHPAIIKAVSDYAPKGISFSAPNENQINLARMISERVKSVEHIRFCNSGTEATMHAIKAARIFSGKSKIVKIEGGYHGTHDIAEVSLNPGMDAVGPVDRPQSVPKSRGIPKSVLEEVIVIPFNNKEVAKKRIREHCNEIACVIVEPIMGSAGMIMPQDGYLQFLRDLTRELKLLLIFDEIVTFRLAHGGSQEIFGVEPDLTTFGKIIGGGFPVGAFGGSREIMKIYSPLEKSYVSQSGTFNANPITIEAGIACLRELTINTLEHINSLGTILRKGLDLAFREVGIKGQTTGWGSLGQIHLNSENIRDYRSVLKGNYQAMLLLHFELLERGINIAPRGGELAISTPMTENEINTFLSAFRESIVVIKPFLQETTPHLISE